MQRRALLAASAATLVGGCVSLGQEGTPEPRIDYISVTNDHDRRYDVSVVVTDGGETVFDDSGTVGTNGDDATFAVEQPVDGAGEYVVRATIGEEQREVDVADFVDGDESCVGIWFTITDGGSVVYDTKSVEEC